MANLLLKICAGIVAALIVGGTGWWVWHSQSTASVSMLGLVGALALLAIALVWSIKASTKWEATKTVAQGIVPLITIVAVCIGAGLYFLERKDRLRISFSVETSVVRLTPGTRPARQVLLTIRIPIENKGERQVVIRCMSVDVLHPAVDLATRRNDFATEELAMESIREPINYRSVDSARCLEGEEALLHRPAGSIQPLFMWDALQLEPNDMDDRYLEIPVSCDYPFVRVLVKIRISPGDVMSNETKTIVPLADTCSGAQDSHAGISRPTIEGGGIGDGGTPDTSPAAN